MAQFLVIQLARFGDILQTKRLLLTLLARGQVHLCVDNSLAALARLVYPEAEIHAVRAHGAPSDEAFVHNAALFARLRGEAFTQVYNLNHSGLNCALARLFDPAQVRGYAMRGNQPLHDPWVRMAFRWTAERRRAPLNLVDFWAHFAPKALDPALVNPPARGQGRGLGVVLAGREQRRSLSPHVLAQAVRTAFESMGGVPVYLLGSTAEMHVARQLVRALPGGMLDKVHNLAGKTDWHGLVEALSGLDALLSPDTGTMHLAAHLGVPVRAFFLSSAWCFETGPYGEGHSLWQACPECAPCLEASPCLVASPCPASQGTPCAACFSSPAFVRSLAAHCNPHRPSAAWLGTASGCVSECMVLHSALDDLGTFWQGDTEQDAFAEERRLLRALVTEYAEPSAAGKALSAPSAALAGSLYDESEWMLQARDSIFREGTPYDD